jgi:hypothetical protein
MSYTAVIKWNAVVSTDGLWQCNTSNTYFIAFILFSKEVCRNRAPVLYPADPFVSMAVTSFYLRPSHETATAVITVLCVRTDSIGPGISELAVRTLCQVISYLQPFQ